MEDGAIVALYWKRAETLSAFLAKIIRNLSLDRYDARHAEKRGGGEVLLLLDELAEVIADEAAFPADTEDLSEVLNAFLGRLKPDARTIFLRRYWFGDSVQEISARSGFGESKIKMSLLRTRQSLKEVLEKEGYRV